MVVGSGDATPEAITAWADATVKALPRPGKDSANHSPIEKVSAPEDAPKRRLLIIDKPDRTQTQINAGQIGVLITNKDFFPLYLGNYAFGGPSFSAVLMVNSGQTRLELRSK